MPSVMQTASARPASAASRMASAANAGGTKMTDASAAVARHGGFGRYRTPATPRASSHPSGRDAANDLSPPYAAACLGVKGSLAAGDALHRGGGWLLSGFEYSHIVLVTYHARHDHREDTETRRTLGLVFIVVFVSSWSSCLQSARSFAQAATTLSAASPIVVRRREVQPALVRACACPSSTFVPSRRATIGIGTPRFFAAATTPLATMSQRTMPPKMLISTALTFCRRAGS